MKNFVRDGLSQAGRPLKALQDDYVTIDEQTLSDLLVYGARYSRLIRYYSVKHEELQNWEPFFLSDEAVILALIIKYDLNKSEKNFLGIAEEFRGTNNDYISDLIGQIHKIASTVNLWYYNLSAGQISSGNKFIAVLEGVIQKSLIREIQSVVSFQSFISKSEQIKEFDTTGFGPVWDLPDASKYLWDKSPAGYTGSQIKEHFKNVFYAFYNAIVFLQKVAPSYLQASLTNQDHAAQSSLFIAFASLYGKVQPEINNFTKRHFEFFYKNILKTSPRSFREDHVHLIFPPLLPGNEILLAWNTEFLAGKDLTKKDLVYVSSKDVILNSAKIKILRTLYLEKNNLILPAHHLGYITNVKSSDIPVQEKVVMESDQPEISWSLFGAPRSIYSQVPGSVNADLGFALASNILYLREGTRKIRCTMTFSFLKFEEDIQQLANFTRRSEQEIFEKITRDGFRIFITSTDGWFRLKPLAIDCKIITPESPANTIEFFFQLDSDDPAITAYSTTLHGGALDTRLPVLKFLCNPDSYLYLYSLVGSLEIKTVRFNVEVEGLKNLVMYNNLGKLDPGQPMHPFGISPTLSSFFILGSYEIRSKKITHLDISVEWADLPNLYGGFETYYSGYGKDIKNNSFKVKVESLEKGIWTQQESRKGQEYLLFSYDENSGILDPFTLMEDIYIPPVVTPDFLQSEADFKFDQNTQLGFIKWTLSGPSMAFGNTEYSQLISHTIFTNARKKIPVAMPNSPYNPTINKISVNYSATAEITAYHGKTTEFDSFHPAIFHVHPWGYDKIFPSRKGKPNYLFPQYSDEGNLMIGLADATPPFTLSLFFHLKNDSVSGSQVNLQEPHWSYLDNNEWHALKNHEIISDSTNKFLNPGIITLSIPALRDPGKNTIFPESLTWLKVSMKTNPGVVCSFFDIKTQAVEARWENNGNSFEHLKSSLPPGSIRKTKNPLAGVKEIVQPMSSFGGSLPEDQGEIYRRVSERMKHKNRTGSAYDYEQMILQQFPDLMKVKCFSNLDSQNQVKPGSILIAVIPRIKSIGKNGAVEEPLANSNLLHQIKTFAENHSSPFATIDVCNPIYEKVKVQCSVKFVKGMEGGYFLKLLNNELIERLSPWGKFEENRPRFGESLQCADILSFIQNRPYISFVTGFSVIQITEDRQGHAGLVDTVSIIDDKENETELDWELEPTYPSSILISAAKHSIDVIPEEVSIRPVPTGIDKLELDSTFIIR